MAKVKQEREKILERLAATTGEGKDHENVLRLIKARERSQQQFLIICTTLGFLKQGGLSSVNVVPTMTEIGEIRWDYITDLKTLHDMVAKRNKAHLHQAVPML